MNPYGEIIDPFDRSAEIERSKLAQDTVDAIGGVLVALHLIRKDIEHPVVREHLTNQINEWTVRLEIIEPNDEGELANWYAEASDLLSQLRSVLDLEEEDE